MCSSIRLENQERININGVITGKFIEGNPFKISYIFSGFARIEGSRDGNLTMSDQWKPNKWFPVRIKATEFTERSRSTGDLVNFQAVGGRVAAIVNRDGKLKIVTRASRTPQERACHFRAPLQSAHSSFTDFVDSLNKTSGGNYAGGSNR